MKTGRVLLSLFICLGMLFVVGSVFEVRLLLVVSNFLLVPFLLVYYRFRARKLFLPIVGVLLLLYARDIFLVYGFERNMGIIWSAFIGAIFLLFLCLITGFQKSKVHPVEALSFCIMYGFLAFLFYSLSEVIPEELPTEKWAAYFYLLLLMLMVAGSFTSYILKSHMASLWFLVASASFLVSEVSLFFKVFVIEDVSVNFFFPFFHVVAYLGLVEYGLRRRWTHKLRYF